MEEIESSALSLSSLADFDTTGLSALTSRLPAKGLFIVKGRRPTLTQTVSDDPAKPPLWRLGLKYEILEAQPVDPNIDPDSLVGRDFSESYTFWPDSVQEAIQLMMGRYKLVGLPHEGRFGGDPDKEPGWVDGLEDHVFVLRVRHFTTKDGNEKAGFDWRPYERDEEAA